MPGSAAAVVQLYSCMCTAVPVLALLSQREIQKILPKVEAEGRRAENGLAEGKLLHPQ